MTSPEGLTNIFMDNAYDSSLAPSTPPEESSSSEQDGDVSARAPGRNQRFSRPAVHGSNANRHLDLYASAHDVGAEGSDEGEELDLEEAPLPRYLSRKREKVEDDPGKHYPLVPGGGLAPDLGQYFSLFGTSNEEQVKICRSYANYLAASDPSCRMRRFMPVKYPKK